MDGEEIDVELEISKKKKRRLAIAIIMDSARCRMDDKENGVEEILKKAVMIKTNLLSY